MSSAVPAGWSEVHLGGLIDKLIDFRGRTPKKLGLDWGGGNIKALSANNVKMGRVDFDKECYLASDELYAKWMTKGDTQKDDVLITMEAPLGNVCLVPDDRRYILSQRVILFRTNELVEPPYIYQVLAGQHFQYILQKHSTGSTATGIQQKNIVKLKLLIPNSIKEQKKIASILTSVDEVIENTQKQIDKLQDLKKAIMNELLTKGIGHTEFKDSELGRIPKSWDVVKLSGLCSLHYGKSPKEIEDDDGMYPIYGTGGIVGKTNSALHAGKSIVIGRKGSIDNISFVDSPFWAIDTTYYVEGKNVEMKWLFYRLQHEGLKKYNEASGVPSLSRDTLYNISIQSPPASEQTQICVILDMVDSHISSLSNKLHQNQSLKKSLMQDLLTGKVRVTVN